VESWGTNRQVLAIGPDIIVKIKNRFCLLIDAAIPSDRNVTQKQDEKKLKCSIKI
jgi:hypothetical protein